MTYRLNSEEAREIAKILEHLANSDEHEVVVWEAEVGLATRNGVYIGKAVWHSDPEMWLFEAAEK